MIKQIVIVIFMVIIPIEEENVKTNIVDLDEMYAELELTGVERSYILEL